VSSLFRLVPGGGGVVNPEIRKRFDALFDAHDDAIRALRLAGDQMDRAIHGVGAAVQAMGAANKAHGAAIDAALNANRAAIDLLHRISGEQ
jgi:hypothetical protein